MIYEFRTYQLEPGTAGVYGERVAEKIEKRVEYSPLMGYWYTELGSLNEVLHIWPYNDSNERAEIRQKVVDDGIWPPDAGDLITGQRSEIMIPTSFTEFTGEQEVGPVFEMRTYMYKPGEVNKTIDAWSEFIEERRKYSPCIGAWYTDLGELNKFVHIWSYESLSQRMEVREEMGKLGFWPPKSGAKPLSMDAQILFPYSFSTIK